MELLLLLGQIHQAAGAPLTALPYILSCLLHSTDLNMDLLVSHHMNWICFHVYDCVPDLLSHAELAVKGISSADWCPELRSLLILFYSIMNRRRAQASRVA